jgi:hypothetical protein
MTTLDIRFFGPTKIYRNLHIKSLIVGFYLLIIQSVNHEFLHRAQQVQSFSIKCV